MNREENAQGGGGIGCAESGALHSSRGGHSLRGAGGGGGASLSRSVPGGLQHNPEL